MKESLICVMLASLQRRMNETNSLQRQDLAVGRALHWGGPFAAKKCAF